MFFCPNCHYSMSIMQGGTGSVSISVSSGPSLDTPTTLSDSSELEKSESEQQAKPSSAKAGTKQAYFKCTNCGYSNKLESQTVILSKTSGNSGSKSSSGSGDKSIYAEMINDVTLPHTRNYTCPNKSCKSHNDSNEREAVWFKAEISSYAVTYICKSCKTIW